MIELVKLSYDSLQGAFANGHKLGYKDGTVEGYGDGYQKGYTAGLTSGKENGKILAKTEFWNGYTNSHDRLNYSYAFAGEGWNEATLNTNTSAYKTISVQNMYRMFYENPNELDITKYLNLRTSNCTYFTEAFANSNITRIGEIIVRDDYNDVGEDNAVFRNTFTGCEKLKKIDNIKITATGRTQQFVTAFNKCYALEEIRFKGSNICTGGLSFVNCKKLSRASMESLFEAMPANPVKGSELTLSYNAVFLAFWNDDLQDWDEEWLDILDSHGGWNIMLK